MDDKLSVAKIVTSTSADGPGLRTSLYLQGCKLRCEGCHNSHWWEIEEGNWMSLQEVFDILMEPDENISILGGEPLLQYRPVALLCDKIKRETNKNIWLWSGFTYLTISREYPLILGVIDVLIDGPFMPTLMDPSLRFRGSSNQQIVEVGKMLRW